METQNINAPAVINKAVAEQKREAWGNIGVEIYEQDILLQARAQAAIAKLIIPTSIGEVAKAELALKEGKAERKAIMDTRLGITTPVNNRMSELMLPEKSFDEPLKNAESAIIAIKKADEDRQRKDREKQETISKCREFLTKIKNNSDASFKEKIVEKLNKVYSYALGEGNVQLKDVPDIITIALTRLTEADFKIAYPLNPYDVKLISSEDFVKMCNEVLIIDPKPYLNDYKNQLDLKFSDYEVALNNKVIALQNSAAEAAEAAKKIEAEKVNANVAAQLSSQDAITPVVSAGLKELKKSYVIDMPETVESVIAIMVAFSQHINLCLPKLGITKWFSCTPAQIGTALAKVKYDNDDFNPAGITFKTVDKL